MILEYYALQVRIFFFNLTFNTIIYHIIALQNSIHCNFYIYSNFGIPYELLKYNHIKLCCTFGSLLGFLQKISYKIVLSFELYTVF